MVRRYFIEEALVTNGWQMTIPTMEGLFESHD